MKKQPYIGMIPGHIKDGDDSRSDLLQALGIDGLEPMSIGNYNDGRNDPPIAAVVIDGKQYSLKKIIEARNARIAADEEKAGNMEGHLNYALRGTTADLSSTVTSGKIYGLNKDAGETVSSTAGPKTGYSCAKIACHAGDEFTLTAAIGGSGGVTDDVVCWAFVDGDYKMIEHSLIGTSANAKTLVAPKDGYIMVNHLASATYSLTAKQLYVAASASDLAAITGLPTAPTTDGTYTLKVTVADGTPTYSWVADAAE